MRSRYFSLHPISSAHEHHLSQMLLIIRSSKQYGTSQGKNYYQDYSNHLNEESQQNFPIKMLHFQQRNIMRPFEIIIPILLALYLVWRRPRPFWVRMLPAFTFIALVLHLIIEGYRWQMIPLYALTLMQMLLSFFGVEPKRLGSFLTFILLVVSTTLPVLLPVPSIPAASGPYQVGTRIYELTDPAREEIYSGKNEPRRFQIQVWYPSEPGPSDVRAPWMANAEIFAPAIAKYIRMPSFFLDHLKLVRMPAYQESKVAHMEEGYPVILFSHGWNGFSAQNRGQAIQLASHGYVVVGVQHTYGAVITVFDDGTIARNNPAALPSGAPDDEYEVAARKLVHQWAGDLGYAIDFLGEQDDTAGSPFYESLDLSNVGVYGHSTGGGAAIQFCGTDPRCKALLGMDAFMRPVSLDVLENGVTQPAFFMFSQRWADDVDSRNNQLFHRFILKVPQTFGVISIEGTAHYDFSDLPLLSPLAPRLGLKGPINGKRVTGIINDYLLSFFDGTLKSLPMDLFEQQNEKYNEVRFSRN
jgi:pimeloyl-ACP methyl ester carboxylesterase